MPELSKRVLKTLKIRKAVEKENYTLAYNLLDTPILRETKGELSDYIIEKGKNPMDYFRGEIPSYAFYKSKKVTDVVIPTDIRSIGEHAFEKSSISSISLPPGIIVNRDSFLDSELQSISFYGDLKQKDSSKFRESFLTFAPHLEEAVILGKETGRWLSGCKSLLRVEVYDGVLKVSSSAFSDCSGLEEVILSDTVVHLGSRAFDGCISLRNIVLSENIERIGDDIFLDCSPNMNQYQNGYYLAGRTNPCYYLVTLEEAFGEAVIHEDCKVIDGKAFKTSTITHIELPSGLTAIGGGAFENQKIKSIEIPNQIRTINDNTFLGCNELEEVVMPHPEYIGAKAFMECTSLRTLQYSDEIVETQSQGLIKDYAFFGCRSLLAFEIGKNINRIYSSVFRECEALISIVIPSSVKVLGHRAFYMCKNLQDVTIESKDIDIVDDTVFDGTMVRKIKYI